MPTSAPGTAWSRRQTALIEDLAYLQATGETHPEAVVRRVGYSSLTALTRQLHRLGRPDLIPVYSVAAQRYDQRFSNTDLPAEHPALS